MIAVYIISDINTISGISQWEIIRPDKHHDWLDQRTDEFSTYLPMGSKDAKAGKGDAVFENYSRGVATNRDVWVYNSSEIELSKNMKRHINYCNVQDLKKPVFDSTQAKWDGELSRELSRYGKQKFVNSKIRASLYRPFFKQFLYFDHIFNPRRGIMPIVFPENDSENYAISVPYHADVEFSAIMTNVTPDIQLNKNGQCFPLKTKNENLVKDAQSVHNGPLQDTGRVLSIHNGHNAGSGSGPSRAGLSDECGGMKDNITDYALEEYQTHYGDKKISKKDIFYYTYGILHHPEYRKKYANNLTRELPHIPMAPEFWAFCTTGKKLADLHLSWETCKRYDLGKPKAEFGKYEKMAFARVKKNGKLVQDKTTLKINGIEVFDNMPETKYKVNGRTPLEWAIDRYKKTTDKESGIINDATNIDIIPLIERLVYVGVESDGLVSELPAEFEPKDWEPKKTGMDAFVGSGQVQSRL